MEILVLCTGNICRSPLAEALLRHRLEQAGVPATVASAGFVTEGMGAADETLELLGSRGLDGSAHRSRKLTAADLAPVDLLLGMTREHVREAVLLSPAVMPKAFTLKEVVRRTGALGPRPPEEAVGSWLLRAQHDRTPRAFMGSSDEDDIPDPMGRRFAVHKQTALEIEELIDRFVALAWPVPPA